MKFKRNEKYASIAFYACIISALTAILVMAGLHISSILGAISSLFRCFEPIVIGFILAYLINPAMRFLEKHFPKSRSADKQHPRLRRILALILAYLIYLVGIGMLLWMLIPRLADSWGDLTKKLSEYGESVSGLIDTVSQKVPFINAENLTESMQRFFSDSYSLLQKITPHITSFLTGAISQVTNVFLGIVLSVYFLLYRDRLCAQCRAVNRALLPERAAAHVEDFVHTTDSTFGGFIRGKLLDSLIVGIVTFIVLAIVRMPYSPLVSVIVGVTNVIPFFGPFIGAIPSALIIFIVSPTKAFWFLVIILIIQQFDGNLLNPKILGQSTGLSSLGVILSIIIMGDLFGVAGMFFGVPLFALFVNLVRRFIHWSFRRRGLDTEGNSVPNDPTDLPESGTAPHDAAPEPDAAPRREAEREKEVLPK